MAALPGGIAVLTSIALTPVVAPSSAAGGRGDRGTSGSVSTADPGAPGGTGLFWYDGNGAQPKNKSVIGARDNQGGDHKWVRVELFRIAKPYNVLIDTLENKSGKSHNVKIKVVRVKDRTRVQLRVCLTTREGEITPWCRTHDYVA